LYIELAKFKGEFSLPHCLFTCKTLTSLRLDMPYILKLPTTICFSNLKILAMKSVTFSDEHLISRFFSALTVLEKLELYGCSWGDLKVVGIYLPKLHSLSIREFEESYWDDCMVIIIGNSLKEFYYKGLMFSKYFFNEPVKMKMAHIYIKANMISDQITPNRYKKLLTQLSNVESLRISSEVCLRLPL